MYLFIFILGYYNLDMFLQVSWDSFTKPRELYIKDTSFFLNGIVWSSKRFLITISALFKWKCVGAKLCDAVHKGLNLIIHIFLIEWINILKKACNHAVTDWKEPQSTSQSVVTYYITATPNEHSQALNFKSYLKGTSEIPFVHVGYWNTDIYMWVQLKC